MALALVPKTGQVLFTTFNALYQGAYQAVEKFHEDFATTMPSNSETQLYHWIAQLPGMKEWVNAADRVAAGYMVETAEAHAVAEGYSCALEASFAREAAEERRC